MQEETAASSEVLAYRKKNRRAWLTRIKGKRSLKETEEDAKPLLKVRRAEASNHTAPSGDVVNEPAKVHESTLYGHRNPSKLI